MYYGTTERHTYRHSIGYNSPAWCCQASLASCDRLIAENRWATHGAAVPAVMWYDPHRPANSCSVWFSVHLTVWVCACVCWSSSGVMLKSIAKLQSCRSWQQFRYFLQLSGLIFVVVVATIPFCVCEALDFFVWFEKIEWWMKRLFL